VKKLKILILLHPDLIPPNNVESKKIFTEKYVAWKTEYDVISGLRELGHEILILGVDRNFDELEEILNSIKVDLVFNLLEQFNNQSELDYKVAEFLEERNIPFTGCQSKALKISRDKAASKSVVAKSGVKTPKYSVFRKLRKVNLKKFNLQFPVIVKCLSEEASYGISKKSVVRNDKALLKRIKYMHEKLKVDCIVEEFIEGEELYVGAMGGHDNVMLSPRKLHFLTSINPNLEIYTERAKWSVAYSRKNKIRTRHKAANKLLLKRLHHEVKIICEALQIRGQVRVDFRVKESGEIYFLEANPNPNIAVDDDFCLAALRKYKNYPTVLSEVIKIAFENHKKNIGRYKKVA